MNKLKKQLRQIYGFENPQKMKHFTSRLLSDPVWRRLHPFGALAGSLPILRPMIALLLTAGTAVAVLTMLDNSRPVEEPPRLPEPLVTESTSSTTAAGTFLTAASEYTSSSQTSAAASSASAQSAAATSESTSTGENTTSVQLVAEPTESTYPNVTAAEPASTAASSALTTVSAETTTAAVTSPITANLFPHDYTEDELAQSIKSDQGRLLFGYPENDLGEIATPMFSWFSDNAVFGTVIGQEYAFSGGIPLTVVSVRVEECFMYGSETIPYGTVLRLLIPGGTMTAAEYEAASGKSAGNGTAFYEPGALSVPLETGSDYLFFINHADSKKAVEAFPEIETADDLYVLTTFNDLSVYTSSGDSFYCLNQFQTSLEKGMTRSDIYRIFDTNIQEYSSPTGRSFYVWQHSFLLFGEYSVLVRENGHFRDTGISFTTDDGCMPFSQEYTVTTGDNGEPVYQCSQFTMTWETDCVKVTVTDPEAISEFRLDYDQMTQ